MHAVAAIVAAMLLVGFREDTGELLGFKITRPRNRAAVATLLIGHGPSQTDESIGVDGDLLELAIDVVLGPAEMLPAVIAGLKNACAAGLEPS